MSSPEISVIIPTYNRRAVALNALRSLCGQTLPPQQFEVIVVTDGCSDGTEAFLLDHSWPFEIRVLSQLHSGAGAARNAGAAAARGHLLAFMDDDIEASPEWLEQHRSVHEGRPCVVAVGYLAVPAETSEDFFQIELRYWWEAMFFPLRDPSHRFAYTNLTSGNFSIERQLFQEVGGFRTDMVCHEDYELGYRLLRHGAAFLFNQAAWGWHHERTGLDRSLDRKFEEGVNDVLLGTWYPELRPGLVATRLLQGSAGVSPVLSYITYHAPRIAHLVMTLARRSMGFLEAIHARSVWRQMLNGLLVHAYCMGLKSQLGSYQALRAFVQASIGPLPAPIDVDLEPGIDVAARQLDELRPNAVRLFFGEDLLGIVPHRPGAEPVLGKHLKGILVAQFADEMTRKLTERGLPKP